MADIRIPDVPPAAAAVCFKPGTAQRFLLTVDTEEEFDWTKPIARGGHTVHSVARLARFQEFCEAQGVIPVYLVDYPIATSPAAADILGPAVRAGKADIGVQLHPWVSPPHDEDINDHNSFAGNLPAELEAEKFRRLAAAIRRNFGTAPLIYRAGRYGAGPHTADLLAAEGLAIDTSVRARFDYSAESGPNYRDHPLTPYWLDRGRGLLELPLTTVYTGALRRLGPWLYPRLWRAPALRGALARVRALDRVPLTPEGVTREEALRAIRAALADGLPILVLSFHSPSLAPGYTPYVQSEDDLDALYDWWRTVFAALKACGVASASVRGILDSVALA